MWELRYDLHGRCAVRVAGGEVMARHVEAVPSAPWMIEARCGTGRAGGCWPRLRRTTPSVRRPGSRRR